MKRFLAILGIVAFVGGGWLVAIKDPGHQPLIDADRTRLAETELEGYAAGWVFWELSGVGNPGRAEEIRAESGRNDELNPGAVLHAFCLGAQAAGFEGSLDRDCEEWLIANRAWPTYNGRLSYAWNDAHPYPYGALGEGPGVQDNSRTGGREEIVR